MNTLTHSQVDQYHEQGYLLISDAFPSESIESLLTSFNTSTTHQSTEQGAPVYGIRNLLEENSLVRDLALSSAMTQWASTCLNAPAFPVRGLYFDKLEGANWHLPWHQDLAIAVKEKIETEGYYGWSVKESVPHVIPPQPILNKRIAIRLHLDHCDADNGALKVLPGSHAHGRLDHELIQQWISEHSMVTCACQSGDALLMNPMLLHASEPADNPTHRRVIHIEYASRPLASPLQWHFNAQATP